MMPQGPKRELIDAMNDTLHALDDTNLVSSEDLEIMFLKPPESSVSARTGRIGSQISPNTLNHSKLAIPPDLTAKELPTASCLFKLLVLQNDQAHLAPLHEAVSSQYSSRSSPAIGRRQTT